ncbi:MAG: hypothetical protein ACOVO5_10325, partial [Devosia sp.]
HIERRIDPLPESIGEAVEAPAEMSAYEDTVDHGDRIQSADSIADSYDTAVENVFPEQSAQDSPDLSGQWSERSGEGGEAPDLDQYVASRPSLSEHLSEQINFIVTDPAERLI